MTTRFVTSDDLRSLQVKPLATLPVLQERNLRLNGGLCVDRGRGSPVHRRRPAPVSKTSKAESPCKEDHSGSFMCFLWRMQRPYSSEHPGHLDPPKREDTVPNWCLRQVRDPGPVWSTPHTYSDLPTHHFCLSVSPIETYWGPVSLETGRPVKPGADIEACFCMR